MPVLSFKKQFAGPILGGIKVGTIRAKRKRPIKPGDRLYLYTGLRTKHTRKIDEKDAAHVVPIRIQAINPPPGNRALVVYGDFTSTIAGALSTVADLDRFARGDGFESWAEMCAFWHKEHPESATTEFVGDWILWSNPIV